MKTENSVPLYGGKPISFSADPVLLSRQQAQHIEETFTSLLREVEEFTTSALKDKSTLARLNVPQDLDPTPTPMGLHIPFARFDFLFDGKNIHGLELNTDGTSGYNITEWVADQAKLQPEENPNFELSKRVHHALLEHDPKAKDVVLVDFGGIGTSWEQMDLVKRWNSENPAKTEARVVEPAYRGWHDGALCYRRALSWQLRAQPERAKPFLADWADKKITVVGGWSSDVGMSKAWPAFLKPKSFPQTVLLAPETIKQIKFEKDDWVVKGALSFSGQAILRGIDLNQTKWNACVDNVFRETQLGRHWIGQRRIDLPETDGKPYEMGLYFLNGKPSGYMCRWGSADAISETSDEVLRPVKVTS